MINVLVHIYYSYIKTSICIFQMINHLVYIYYSYIETSNWIYYYSLFGEYLFKPFELSFLSVSIFCSGAIIMSFVGDFSLTF